MDDDIEYEKYNKRIYDLVRSVDEKLASGEPVRLSELSFMQINRFAWRQFNNPRDVETLRKILERLEEVLEDGVLDKPCPLVSIEHGN